MNQHGTDPRQEKTRWNTPDAEQYQPTPCTQCGRMLKAKKSIIRRLGTTCWKKAQMAMGR